MSGQLAESGGPNIPMRPAFVYNQADIQAAIAAEKRRLEGEEYVPAELVYSIMDGENPVRAWRHYRGMTIEALAAQSGTTKSMISKIENGNALGKPLLWRALAEALNVSVDDILPEA